MSDCGPDLTSFQCALVEFGMWGGYILIAIATLLAFGMSLMNMGKSDKGSKMMLFGVGGVILIVLISYFIAGDNIFYNVNDEPIVTAGVSKIAGAGLISAYILGGIGVIGLIYSEVSGFFK